MKLLNHFIFLILLICVQLSAQAQATDSTVYLSGREKATIALALRLMNSPDANVAQVAETALAQLRSLPQLAPKVVKVASFAEFLNLETAQPVFSENSLDSLKREALLELLKPVIYASDTPSVQRRIDRYNANLEATRLRVGGEIFRLTSAFIVATQAQGGTVNSNSVDEFIRESTDKNIQNFSAELNTSNSENVRLLSKLLKMYFKNIPNRQKTRIMYKLLELPLEPKPIDIFQVMIQNSGPQMQKLVQIIGRHHDIPASFQEVFQRLESQVQKVPWVEVKQVIEAEGLDLNSFTYFEHKPIGVGTMAQTHRVQYVNEQGQRVSAVIRFLKPHIEELVEMDHEILKSIAREIQLDPEMQNLRLPSLEKIIKDLHSSVVEELQISDTVRNQEHGREVYNQHETIRYSRRGNELEFYVPKARLRGTHNRLMEQELVVGSKVTTVTTELSDVYPDLYKAVSEKIAEHWFDQVMFKSGFFHADLHQGNLLMQYTEPAVKVYILDFGMVGQLNEAQRESAMLLALSTRLNHPDIIAKHLNLLSEHPRTGAEYGSFLNLVKERAVLISRDPRQDSSMNAWVVWSLEQGISLHYDFLKLNRGLTAVKSMLEDSKSGVTIEKIAERVVFQNKVQTASILRKENLLRLRDFASLVGIGTEAGLNSLNDLLPNPKTKGPVRLRCEALIVH